MLIETEPLDKFSFCFSVDLDTAMGIDHSLYGRGLSPKLERKATLKLIDLVNKYSIPTTFAVLGHAFLRNCTKNLIPHPDMPRPVGPQFYDGDWYKNDPCTNFKENKFWYMPDIVEKIIDSEIHELASHSFSHALFADKSCTREVAEADIRKCVEIAKEHGIKLESFVFPRNEPNYIDLLKKYGFKFYVGSYHKNTIIISKSIKNRLLFPKPKRKNRMIDVPRTFHFSKTDLINMLRLKTVLFLAKNKNAFVHLWTHCYTLTTSRYFQVLDNIFKNIKKSSAPILRIKDCEELV